MNAAFSSWQAFFDMGGYAFYVWLSVAATLISLIALVVHTMVQRRQILADVRRRQAREKRIVQSKRNPTNESPAATKPAVPRLKPDASGEKLL
ncbi:MAG: heme exporter protein CcmD [Ewingella americana]|jgi:heme exporter protein D|uniref:heme exporter protein CcmD n=1 Tax=Ewingella americana TaxID=41202 RepID=UPI002432CA5D|nr:heme exporter protein CcmD [Ewingella americana]MCI1677614.1 heme exporter protein CcmD [Ewingella americana]MCI1852697.1 heme exporter protein CcmD [Ewingella americana]MCI1861217.1 heme exporter protein CcmD [Ewingella americana]MCI2143966.1 heme exporter protein CcmD [Ewingella americana]MCI2162736.1 heme exporter protein CcmD [Ewingella americana]